MLCFMMKTQKMSIPMSKICSMIRRRAVECASDPVKFLEYYDKYTCWYCDEDDPEPTHEFMKDIWSRCEDSLTVEQQALLVLDSTLPYDDPTEIRDEDLIYRYCCYFSNADEVYAETAHWDWEQGEWLQY